MPVSGASIKDYDQNAFGAPRVGHKHKGVDIFAPKGRPVVSATNGIVLFTGVKKLGGNAVVVLGLDCRFYYYAHLDKIETTKYSLVSTNEEIGTVGNTGNAIHTPSHLHFSIWSANPFSKKGFLNPVPLLNKIESH
jgi:murein DD-endopeptidase MepM/ murein hydrolase activator NlpD